MANAEQPAAKYTPPAPDELEIEQANLQKPSELQRQVYDPVMHGAPTFQGHFVAAPFDGSLILKDTQGKPLDTKDARLVHVPPAVAAELKKNTAVNKLIEESIQNGQGGKPLQLVHTNGDWAVRNVPAQRGGLIRQK